MDASVIGRNVTKLHLVELETGVVSVFESEDPFVCIHFANTREIEDEEGGEVVTFEMPTWRTKADSEEACNPYAVFDFFRVSDNNARDDMNKICENTFKPSTKEPVNIHRMFLMKGGSNTLSIIGM